MVAWDITWPFVCRLCHAKDPINDWSLPNSLTMDSLTSRPTNSITKEFNVWLTFRIVNIAPSSRGIKFHLKHFYYIGAGDLVFVVECSNAFILLGKQQYHLSLLCFTVGTHSRCLHEWRRPSGEESPSSMVRRLVVLVWSTLSLGRGLKAIRSW